jgi:hypothetical protein
VGKGLVCGQEALLLPDGSERMPFRVATTFRPPTFGSSANTRHLPVRLQRGLSQLLPLLEVAMVPGEEGVLLQEREQGMQVEYACVGEEDRILFVHVVTQLTHLTVGREHCCVHKVHCQHCTRISTPKRLLMVKDPIT